MNAELNQYMKEQLALVSLAVRRYMYNKIDWGRRMFGLVGPRGVGKTTMFLQYIKESTNKCFYVSADHTYFASHSLIDVADEFIKEGGEYLFIDEIHKYEGWSTELKQIYDSHPELKIAFTGSSLLDITSAGEADLSRRAPIYLMQGLSFREFLEMFKGISAPVFSFEDIVSGKVTIPDLKHPLPYFKEYLHHGYYPFGDDPEFNLLLVQIMRQTMETDIPHFANMTPATGRKLFRLLGIIAESVPFKPNMDNLADILGVSRNILPTYFMYMEKAGMIEQLRDGTGGIGGFRKVEKVYLDNTNQAFVLGGNATVIGNIRETFFFNQMRINNDVSVSPLSDFCIGKYTFEVGGKKKGKKQIADITNGYVVRDDIEYASGNIIPLWHFGLNY